MWSGYFMKILIALTSCFFIFSLCGCSGLYYYPDSYMYYDPQKLPVTPRQIELQDQQGRKIVGWYFQNKRQVPPKARILFFHGNAQNISSHFVSLFWILEHDYDYFIFDYPGYGGSEGEPNRDSVVEASLAALSWIHQQKPQRPVAVFGQSLGGNISLYTVARYQKDWPICQVTVDSTFYSYPEVAKTILAESWWTWALQWMPYLLVSNAKSASENLQDVSPTPLIVLHGDKDRNVRIQNGRRVFSKAKEPKEFWLVPEGGHIEAFTGPQKEVFQKKYIQALQRDCASPQRQVSKETQ